MNSRNLKSNAEILIVGAGGGAEIQHISTLQNSWHITGIDPSPDMCNKALSIVNFLDMSDRVDIISGHVSNLDKNKYFSAATSILVMHLLKDDGGKLEYLNSIVDHLESGSPFIHVDFCGDKTSSMFLKEIEAWKRNAINNGITPDLIKKQESTILTELPFVSENREISLLKEAGFSKITTFYQSFMYKGWIAHKSY